MHKILIFHTFVALFLASFAPVSGHAGVIGDMVDGVGKYFWGSPKSPSVKPYLEDAKIPHNSRWADDEWTPQDWIDSRGGNPMNVINGLYDANIITDQYFEDGTPVLEVGRGFIELGAQDKRRVVAFVDEVFGVTEYSEAGVILIYFEEEDLPVGEFNAKGLQLQ